MLCEKTTQYGKACMATAIQGSKNCFFHASDEEVANHRRIKQEKFAEKKARRAQREVENLIRKAEKAKRKEEAEKIKLQREAERKARPRNFTLKKLFVRHWVGLILLETDRPMEQPEVYDIYGNMMGKHTTSHAIYSALKGPQFKEEIVGRRFVFTICDEKFKKEMEELREWVKRTDKTPNFSIRKYFGWDVSRDTPAVSTPVASEPTSVSDVIHEVEKMNLDSGETPSSSEVRKPLSDTCYECKTIPDYDLTPCCVCKEAFCEECSLDGKCMMCYSPVSEVKAGDHVVWINSQKALRAVVLKTTPHSFDVSICTQISGGGGTIYQVSVNDLYERVRPVSDATTSTPPSEGEEWILVPEATVEHISSDSNSHANLPETNDSTECANCSASRGNCVEEYKSHLKFAFCGVCKGVYCDMCILDGACIMCCVEVESVSEGDRVIYINDMPVMIYVTVTDVDSESDTVFVRCDDTSIHYKQGEIIKTRLRSLCERQ